MTTRYTVSRRINAEPENSRTTKADTRNVPASSQSAPSSPKPNTINPAIAGPIRSEAFWMP